MKTSILLAALLCGVLACAGDAPTYDFGDRYLCTVSGTETFYNSDGTVDSYTVLGETLELNFGATYLRFRGADPAYYLPDDTSIDEGLRVLRYRGPNLQAYGAATLSYDGSVYFEATLQGAYGLYVSGTCGEVGP